MFGSRLSLWYFQIFLLTFFEFGFNEMSYVDIYVTVFSLTLASVMYWSAFSNSECVIIIIIYSIYIAHYLIKNYSNMTYSVRSVPMGLLLFQWPSTFKNPTLRTRVGLEIRIKLTSSRQKSVSKFCKINYCSLVIKLQSFAHNICNM